MSSQTISNRAIFIIAITAVSAVFVSSFFTYLTERERSKIEKGRIALEEKRIMVEDKLADIEREKIAVEMENIKINATSKITIDKMTNCMKTMMEETRNNKGSTLSPEKAREACKDLQNIK